MSFQARKYQAKCLDQLTESRRHGKKRALVVMASGLGKTVTAALDAKRWLTSHGGKLLYLCHQNDILEQARTTFESVLGSKRLYGYFHGQEKDRHRVDCLFASFQTMRKNRNGFKPREFSYTVVDESHHGHAPTYRPTLDYFQPKFLLGITATPERTDLKDIREIYGEEAFSLHIEDALAQGLLTPVDYYLLTDNLQMKNLKKALKTPIGKLSIRDLNRKLFIPRRDKEIARIVQEHMKRVFNPRVMIFCPSIQYCERLSAHLPYSLAIHSSLPYPDQRERLESFRNGLANIVLTVDKFNEGLDIPEANVIVFLRSTASRTVFFQQLGRGLRQVPGKKKVVVLDFVANCDRLQMVSTLWHAVHKKRGEYKKSDQEKTQLNVDMGGVHFTKEARDVLDVLFAIRGGYTKEILIKQLRELAEEIGRTPTQDDLLFASKIGKCASPSTFSKLFGSLNVAVRAANLSIEHYTGYKKTELIEQLKRLAKELCKTPTVSDVTRVSRAGEIASVPTFLYHFGSFNTALKTAQLRLTRMTKLTKQELVDQLKSLQKSLGKTPKSSDVNKAAKIGKCAHVDTFRTHFGSFNAALTAAGLRVNRRVGYTKRDAILQLRLLNTTLGRIPTSKDVAMASKTRGDISLATIGKMFGTYALALKAANFHSKRVRMYKRGELLESLKKLRRTLGRAPQERDIDRTSKESSGPSTMAYRRAFGSLRTALKSADISSPSHPTRRELVRQLVNLRKDLGKIPTFLELTKARKKGKVASIHHFYKIFGSLPAALKASGLT